MKIAIAKFPGTNREQDMRDALSWCGLSDVQLISSQETSLPKIDLIILPGGFSYGDYLRSGAIAAHTPLMHAVKLFAQQGGLVMGVCNGFQILTESNLLPGVLLQNQSRKFICRHTPIIIANNKTTFTNQYDDHQIISIPIAHMNGRYFVNHSTYQELKKNKQITLYYKNDINGSSYNIAGITNKKGNILGMMPHFENAVFPFQESRDGFSLFQSLKRWISEKSSTR